MSDPRYSRQSTAPASSSRINDLFPPRPVSTSRSSPAPTPARFRSSSAFRSFTPRPTSKARARTPSRARSASVFHESSERRLREDIRNQHEADARLKSVWFETILQKYGDVPLGEDDEIDLVTFKVKKYTGHLERYSLDNKFSWDVLEEEDEEGYTTGVEDSEESEDELGGWGEKEVRDLAKGSRGSVWNPDDPDDLLDREAFLRDEARRRALLGLEEGEEEDDGVQRDDEDEEDYTDDDAPQSKGEREDDEDPLDLATLLFDADSDDELLAQTSDAEEATRLVYTDGFEPDEQAPCDEEEGSAESEQEITAVNEEVTFNPSPRRTIKRGQSILEVVIPIPPPRSISVQPSSLVIPPVPRADIDPSLDNFFSPAPVSPVVQESRQVTAPVAGPSRLPSQTPDSVETRSTSPITSLRSKRAAKTPKPRTPSTPLNLSEGHLDSKAYFSAEAFWRDGTTKRLCQACTDAGGVRAERANLCKGRRGNVLFCTFVTPSPTPTRSRCRQCVAAGGIREERAGSCRGRSRPRNCTFESITPPESTPKRLYRRSTSVVGAKTSPTIDTSKLDSRRYHGNVDSTPDGRLTQCAACKAAGGLRETRAARCRGRRRAAACTFAPVPKRKNDDSDDDSLRSWSGEEDNVIVAEPIIKGSSHGEMLVDLADEDASYSAAIEDARRIRNLAARELQKVHQSLPPSSPPTIFSQSSMPSSSPPQVYPDSLVRSDVPPRPTPSPSTSAPYVSTPVRSAHLFLPSTISARSAGSVRALTSFGPTPPSSVGHRSSSIASDLRFSSGRRGILREPTDFDRPSPARSLKKARFSLGPLSPSRAIVSDYVPLVNADDDEILLRPGSTTPSIRAATEASRRPRSILRATTESLSSTELHVRARDLGLKLPEHTGRLSSDMLAALAPIMSARRDTVSLASSLRYETTYDSPVQRRSRSVASGQYSLPTPPPSFNPSRAASTGITHSPKTNLMLPPPVPSHAIPVHRLPTPVSAEEDDEPTDKDTTKQFTTPNQMPLIRSRAKSLGALSEKRKRSSSATRGLEGRLPSTTPRKRTKLERDLAREARRLGDEEGLEWGLDDDVGEELGRLFRESSVFQYVT